MPGKHAPPTPRSFYLSLARAIATALGIVGVVVAAAILAVGSRGDADLAAEATLTASVTPSATETPVEPAATESPTEEPSEEPSPSPTPTEQTLAPTRVTVEVLNGTGRTGLASKTRKRIASAGYRVTSVGNAPAAESSTVFYMPGFEDEARALVKLFPELGGVERAEGEQEVMLRVVLGGDFP